MTLNLGPIRQLGYVVDDIEAAMAHWTEVIGVGPFFYKERIGIENYMYKGERYEPHNSIALANSGPIQVELVQTRNDVPSMYRDFMQAGLRGLQHIAFWTNSYDADLARLKGQGFVPVMQGEVGANGRFIYFDKQAHPGTVIELSEVMGPKGRMFDMIRKAADDWDGKDPIRDFPDLSKI